MKEQTVPIPDNPVPDWLYHPWWKAAYWATFTAMTLGFSLRVRGRENIPRRGPALLIANHQSFLDPPVIGLASTRSLCYLARKTLFDNPAFAWVLRSMNSIPIDQEGVGKDGIRSILAELQRGQAVLVFPEGERCLDGALHPLRPGIHLLLKRVKAPIVPIGVAGAYQAWPRWRLLPTPSPLFFPATERTVAVAIGQPIDPRPFEHLGREQFLAQMFTELQKVVHQAEHLRRKR